MNSPQDTLKTALKSHALSITQPRLRVFEALLGQPPLTMRALLAKLGGQVDKVSVYRTVDVFERLGIAQRLYSGWKYKIELNGSFDQHHHHLTCFICGRVIDINEPQLETFIEQLASRQQFTPAGHQIEVQGRCANCQDALTGEH